MNKPAFYISLWTSKLFTFIFKLQNNYKDDRTGYLARRIYGDFIHDVAKPATTCAVTGTNGKTGIVCMISQIFQHDGLNYAANDWGVNDFSSQAWVLANSVNLLNHPVRDLALFEFDEKDCESLLPDIKPDYLLLTNLSRDSNFRNAYPEYVRSYIEKGLESSSKTHLVLNADDPLSCFIGKDNPRTYYGVSDMHLPYSEHKLNNFSICPVCSHKPEYEYHNYLHIGKFHCPECGLTNPVPDYLVIDADENLMTVKEKDGLFNYPVKGPGIYNLYNSVAIVALLRTMGYTPEHISELLEKSNPPEFRDRQDTVAGVNIYGRAFKNINPSAGSVVIENMVREPGEKIVFISGDEEPDCSVYPKFGTSNWIYDIDYGFLSDEHIHQIIFTGERCLDHRMSALIDGVDENKIVAVRNIPDAIDYMPSVKGIDSVYFLRGNLSLSLTNRLYDSIKEKIRKEKENEN